MYQRKFRFNTVLRSFLCKNTLRWYRTPSNIYKDEKNFKKNYNHGFKNFKIDNICHKNAYEKLDKRNKK